MEERVVTNQYTFPDVYWNSHEDLLGNWEVLLYLFIGAMVTFLYIAANKYYTFWGKETEVVGQGSTTRKKYEGVIYIWYSGFKSLVFRICFFYGLAGAGLFLLIMAVDLSDAGALLVPQRLVIISGVPLIDFIFAGVVFACTCYPILTGNLIGLFGLSSFEKMLAKPTDTNIEGDIDNARRDYIKAKIKHLSKTLGVPYTIAEFKKHLKEWYDMQRTINSADLLELALLNADQKYPHDVINYIGSVMKSFGDANVRRALNYRL